MAHDADLERLLRCVPPRIAASVNGLGPELVEIALDIGRPPTARLIRGYTKLSEEPVTKEEIGYVIGAIGEFQRANRVGIEGTLHRLSAMRNRYGDWIAITIRIGRHLTGVAAPLRPILTGTDDSILLIGAPGCGKTTLLRDCACVLSETLGPAVIVVDSHNEIGGEGDLPHPAIGTARRMQVPGPNSPAPATQFDVMIEAVRNHFPEVVIVDEITTRQETDAARTIARRGVRLIATAHGKTLADVAHNPDLCGLVGSPAMVGQVDGARATRTEPPIMTVAIEVHRDRTIAVHRDVAQAVDAILADAPAEPDEVVQLPVAQQQTAPAPPPLERTDESIPESDPWGWTEEDPT